MIDGPQIEVVDDDITRLEVDAVVNAANEALAPGGGVCGAIHRAAGPALARACREAGPCRTGEARLTPGFDLPARWVIHAVGPVWRGGGEGEPTLLASCYAAGLALAAEAGCRSIAFPAISTGIYGYPASDATRIAVATVRRALSPDSSVGRVVFCCFGAEMTELYRAELARARR